MRIVFMGTPDFAAEILKALIGSRHELAAVVTQPDRPKGRGKALQCSPVKELALEHGIPVLQPEKIRKGNTVEELRKYAPDLIAVAAFGQILPASILELPPYGCINVHASLLPKYRGASPIQRAVADGQPESGVTTMLMDRGLDTGDILLKESVTLDPKETGDSLHDKLAAIGGPLLLKTIDGLEQHTLVPEKQNDEESCYAPMLSRQDGEIDWSLPAVRIERLIRGMTSWPGAHTVLRGRGIKLWDADVWEDTDEPGGNMLPGTVVKSSRDTLLVQTGEGLLSLRLLQPDGKKRMPVDAFLRGYPVSEGDCFEMRKGNDCSE